jgi:F5/8 type C domain-containing protein
VVRSKASRHQSPRLLLLALWLAACVPARGEEAARVLDGMQDAAAWTASASDGVAARLEPLTVDRGLAVRLGFDFHGGAGYALAGRPLALDLPENFEITVQVRSSTGANPFELKLVDASGDNVWWYRLPSGRLTSEWQTLRIRRRQIEFAWGPTNDRQLRHTERLEFVVHAGPGPSQGTLDVGPILMQPLPPPPLTWPTPQARDAAGSALANAGAAVDGDERSAWQCTRSAQPCVLTVDYTLAREFGGLKLVWAGGRRASRYEVALSDDGSAWRVVRQVTDGDGVVDWLWLGESEARLVRLTLESGPADAFALAEVSLLDVEVGAHLNSFIADVARASPRGYFPRGFGEQSYWTLVGFDGGSESGLLSEDGAVELGRGGPSVEPFVVQCGRVLTWADVEPRQRLASGYLPIPTVTWHAPHFTLAVTAVAHRNAAGAGLWVRYRLANRSRQPLQLRLVLAARPFQVNPAAQFLTTPGGVSPVRQVAWDGTAITLNRRWHIVPLQRPDAAGVYDFDRQAVPAHLAEVSGRAPQELTDAASLASGAFAYDVKLPAAGHRDLGLFVPWESEGTASPPMAAPSERDLEAALASETRQWQQRLNRVVVRARGSAEGQEVSNALRTALAHIILSRAGALLRPGTRAYARSWIRDGSMMSDALLRLGEEQLPKDYLLAYARFQFADGKVPCCVDERGADPVPEHDSEGEFIHLAAEVLRRTGDEALVRSVWPRVRAAAAYLDHLRREARSAPGGDADAAYAGLLPPSISHEGYSAKPMHSYWDDFWALRGYSDAVFLATRLGERSDAAALESARREFARNVLASIDLVHRRRGIDYIPGAADLGDFDATSTTIALSPGIGPVDLPRQLLESTFERYWHDFTARRDGTREWHDYTPYEWRSVGTFVRLGWPERAHAALKFFLDGRRPPAWQQWPEVVDRDPRHARFIGDLPHGWVASDFIRAALDLFAFERESDGAVVLAAGVPADWLVGEGVEVRGLVTQYGPVSYRLRRRGRRTELTLLAAGAKPPGGFVYRGPAGLPNQRALMDDPHVRLKDGEWRIDRAPAHVVLVDPSLHSMRRSNSYE